MDAKVGVSNRHIHLTVDDYKTLCGDTTFGVRNSLVQPGEFASTVTLTIKTEKSIIEKVRVLGPLRDYTQVEVSKTDAYKLGLNPPIRKSGDLVGSSLITLVGPCGEISKECCIIANRHIHINHEERISLGLLDVDVVKIKIGGEKGAIMNNVYLKESDKYVLELHLDTDDANATFLKTNDIVEIIK